MAKVLTVIGARPQFIKVAPVSRALGETKEFREVLVHTGQHSDVSMSEVFFRELGLASPDYHLGITGGGHGAMTGAMLQRLESVMECETPDIVLVYGDTNSTLAGALAAAKLHVPIAHVEAGLRSFNRRMPEEQNRVVTDHLADWLFTPTRTATDNLIREGLGGRDVNQVGDVMFDAALIFGDQARKQSDILGLLGLDVGSYVLATVHRAENTDNPVQVRAIFDGLETIAKEVPVVLPLHPRTRKAMQHFGVRPRHVRVIEPVGYLDMVALECQAAVIATDSGGVQKEAYFHTVPCVTLRHETEWVELIELGWNRLAPPGESDIAVELRSAIGTKGRPGDPYGKGNAAKDIASILARGLLVPDTYRNTC